MGSGSSGLKRMTAVSSCPLRGFLDGTVEPRDFAWIASNQEPQVSWNLALELQSAGLRVALEVAVPGLHRSMRIPVVALGNRVLGVFKVATNPAKVDESVLDCVAMMGKAGAESRDLGVEEVRGFVALVGRAGKVTRSHLSDDVRLLRVEDVGYGLFG